VYGSEAHPEEHPFSEGYESKDLGWTHPYTITHEMEERAQRARWMKSDPEPDFEIPMLIDYVGHPDQPDDAIRRQYRGSGFYSAYLIDCDGKVIRAHNWGWFAPGFEWWGLPLAPISELHEHLDQYLANPPACYAGESPDGGSQPDAGSGPDAGEQPDAGEPEPGGKGGGCGLAGAGPVGYTGVALAVMLGVVLGLRRRED